MSAAVARIDEMTQQNSALAEQSAASATELMAQIERLNGLVARFRVEEGAKAAAAAPAAESEPERLRRMAADAFAQSRVTRPAEPPRMVASGGGRGDWAEF